MLIVRARQRRETFDPVYLIVQLGYLEGLLALQLQIHEGQRETLLRSQRGLLPRVDLLGILS